MVHMCHTKTRLFLHFRKQLTKDLQQDHRIDARRYRQQKAAFFFRIDGSELPSNGLNDHRLTSFSFGNPTRKKAETKRTNSFVPAFSNLLFMFSYGVRRGHRVFLLYFDVMTKDDHHYLLEKNSSMNRSLVYLHSYFDCVKKIFSDLVD